jgi:hypothetical protein
MRRIWAALVTTAVTLTAAAAQPIPVSVELTPQEITVGDHVSARLTLVWDGDAPQEDPRFPTWAETWGPAELLHVGEVELSEAAGRRVYVQTLTLTAFTTGEILLPTISVAIPMGDETVQVPSRAGVGFTVRSVLGESGEEGEGEEKKIEPRGAAPLRRPDQNQRFYWTNAVLAALCLLAASLLSARLGHLATTGGTQRHLDPFEELVAGLGEVDSASSEPAHTAMSLILRRFLSRRFDMNALELTSSEIQRRLHGVATQGEARRGVKFLRQFDQVKFARQEVSPEITSERLDATQELAEEIEERLRPRPEETV